MYIFDHFIKSKNVKFTGLHILLDMQGISKTNEEVILAAENCLNAVGATILNKTIHTFEENNGITGCYALAESHFTFHSWWEAGGTLIMDLYTCGITNPLNALKVIREQLNPAHTTIHIVPRGPIYSNNKDKFNTYVLIDPRNNIPFYVGKGTKNRLKETLKPHRCNGEKREILEELNNLKLSPKQHIVIENTTEDLALLVEAYLINFYKPKIYGGSLVNIQTISMPCNGEKISETLKKYNKLLSEEKKKERSENIKLALSKEDINLRKERIIRRNSDPEYIRKTKEGRENSISYKNRNPNRDYASFRITYANGEEKIISNFTKFCKDNNYNFHTLTDRIVGNGKVAKKPRKYPEILKIERL